MKCHFTLSSYAFLVADSQLKNFWRNESDKDAIEQLMKKDQLCPQLDNVETVCLLLKKDFEMQGDQKSDIGVELQVEEASGNAWQTERPRSGRKLFLSLKSRLQLDSSMVIPFCWKIECAPVVDVTSVLIQQMVRPFCGMVQALAAQTELLKQRLIAKDKELKTLRTRLGAGSERDRDTFWPSEFEQEFLSDHMVRTFDTSTLSVASNPHLATLYTAYVRHSLQGLQTAVPPSPQRLETHHRALEMFAPNHHEKAPPELIRRESTETATAQEQQRRRQIEEELTQKKRKKEEKERSTPKKIAKALR
mmetsp:Transcript_85292/g.142488  ORF Transcript_85292/g.142488 Transcript_85292/m.142488 type:complete len:306 (-) Transcript_85292:192-1109(-)